MQFGFILLVLVVVLHGSGNVVSASISADAPLVRVDIASIGGKGARSLRTSEVGDDGYDASNEGERADNAVAEKTYGFIARVFGLGKPAASTSDVTKTVASAPKVDDAMEALKSEGEALVKLARSKSISKIDDHFYASVKTAEKKLRLKQFTYFDKDRKLTPDDMIEYLKLDPKVAGGMTSKNSVAHLEDVVFGEYVLWFRYFKYYTKTHKEWASQLATPVLRKQATTG